MPEDADSDVYDLLESILHGIVNQTPSLQRTLEEQRAEQNVGETISQKLVTGIVLNIQKKIFFRYYNNNL